MSAVSSASQTTRTARTWENTARSAGFFFLFLICGILVSAVGVDYHTHFWTNTSSAFKIGISVFFLGAALILRRNERWHPYSPVAFAFFAASLTNVTTWYLAGPLQGWLLGLFQLSVETAPGLAMAKLVDTVLRLTPIFAFVWLAGDGLGSLYLRKGTLRWSLTIGLLALANLLATAFAIAASRGGDLTLVLASLPWWFAFALMNGFMEEIWFRGLFLQRLEPTIGSMGAIWLTTLVFTISHLFVTYIEPSSALVFGIITLTLGFAWALLMQKTNTLWGSVIFHLAADLYWLIAFGF